jgi:mannitol/fructose-specific phosphotransferase system IIA component (Ntr-type)
MTEEAILPSNPVDRKKIRGQIHEAAVCLQRIEDQRALYRDILNLAKDEHQIAPKLMARLVKTYHKQNFREQLSQQQDFEEFYELIVAEDKEE